jgi:hypothetical protein
MRKMPGAGAPSCALRSVLEPIHVPCVPTLSLRFVTDTPTSTEYQCFSLSHPCPVHHAVLIHKILVPLNSNYYGTVMILCSL